MVCLYSFINSFLFIYAPAVWFKKNINLLFFGKGVMKGSCRLLTFVISC